MVEQQTIIEEESQQFVDSLKTNINSFNHLLEKDKPGRREATQLKERYTQDKINRQKMVNLNHC